MALWLGFQRDNERGKNAEWDENRRMTQLGVNKSMTPGSWWVYTQILCSFVVKHAMQSGMYLWVEEWARVEELWDLEDCRLPGKGASAPCLMTLSVAGTFLEIYYNWERKRVKRVSYWQKTLHHNQTKSKGMTYIYHRYLLRTRSWVIGSVGQVAIGMIHINVLPQMIVHLLPLFPGGEATVRQCHSLRHRPRVTIITSHLKTIFIPLHASTN